MLLPLFPIVTWAQTYRVLHSFTGSAGAGPFAGLVAAGNTLYGTTCYGGTAGFGTVFKLNTDGSGFAVLHEFNGFDGANPYARLLLSGTTLYGTTEEGGSSYVPNAWNGSGTVFKLNIDGSEFTVVKSFMGYDDGDRPYAGLAIAGTTLYGTTAAGGTSTWRQGTVFSVNTDGTDFKVLHSLDDFEGSGPWGGLLLAHDTLYGTARANGVIATNDSISLVGNGVVFSLNTNGSGYTVLKNFNDSEGSEPFGDLLLVSNVLYGTTLSGTIFKVNTDGSDSRILKRCTQADGVGEPKGGLVLSGHTLFGASTSLSEGIADAVFKINTDGGGFAVIKNLSGSQGNSLQSPMVLLGTNLYGTTFYGGASNRGVVFSLSVPIPMILEAPRSQTAEVGDTARFDVTGAGEPPLFYRWFFYATNSLGDFGAHRALLLTNLQPAQAGAYTLVVSNAFDSVTSAPALLSIVAPVERKWVPAITLTGLAGLSLNLEYADTVASGATWLPMASVSLESPSQFYFDLSTPLPPERFYRAQQTAYANVLPALDLHMVPAITLTGVIGSSVRVDCINRFGPVDAWNTLTVEALTNTSQLFFDTSVIDQPARVYRLVPVR